MTALLLLASALFIAASIGRRILDLLRTVPASRLDRLAISSALGFGVIAYAVLALGLVGALSLWPAVATLAALLLLSWVGMLETILDLQPRARPPDAVRHKPISVSTTAAGVLLASAGAIVVINCFVPPGPHEWDALSYHLAAPKVYLLNHRILFLPTDHHSNFPFLVEMLFTLGLLFNGFALANLFHFALAALTVGALLFLGRRHFSPRAGLIAAVAFATTPIAMWEAGAAYIELGMALYVLLAFGAALEFRLTNEPRWLLLAGILMGFALSVKALALVPFAILAGAILLAGYRFKNLRWYLVPALIVGCPFYVKTFAMTGNPVYPFAYNIFGGKYWSQELADAYAGTQGAFGLHNQSLSASDDLKGINPDPDSPTFLNRIRNTLLSPFALVSLPRIFYDLQDPGTFSQAGFLFLALPMAAVVVGGLSSSSAWLGFSALAWMFVWSQTMQYVRYMIPLIPLLVLVGGEGADRAAGRAKFIGWLMGGALFLQSALALAYWVPRLFANPGGAPGQIETAFNSEAREQYLTKSLNYYSAVQWINRNAPTDAGVALFEEARGFYLNRPYLWGNTLHSTYIPYAQIANGRELADWFLDKGIRYALINLQFTHDANTGNGADLLRQASAQGTLGQLFLQWYEPTRGGERFRGLLGDAVLDGSAAFVSDAMGRGVVVLEFRRSGQK